MRPHEVLGVARDASVADIKRAYAALVKRHRPDEDAAAFQRIHQAFEACLAQAHTAPRLSTRAARVPVGADAELATASVDEVEARPPSPVPPPLPPPPRPAPPVAPVDFDDDDFDYYDDEDEDDGAPAPAPAAPAFDVGPFVLEYRQLAEKEGAPALLRWLQAQPAFYSIDQKRWIRRVLFARLGSLPPLRPHALTALLQFFDLDTVGAGQREQVDVEGLQRRSAAQYGWDDLSFMDSRARPKARDSGVDIPWRVIFIALWVVAHMARCAGS